MPKLALSTGSLHTYGVARVFELAAQAGFDDVEILLDQRWDTRHPAYLWRLTQATGLPVVAVHSPFMADVPGWPLDPVERLRRTAAVARGVEAPVVVAHLPLRTWFARIELIGRRRRHAQFPLFLPFRSDYHDFLLTGLAEFEAREKVVVGVENMPCRRLLGFRMDIYSLNKLDVLARMPHVTLDTTHLATWGLDPLAGYRRVKERLVHVHLSNFTGKEHRLPEDGRLPLGNLLRALVQDGYQGAVSLEFGPEVLQAENETQVLANLRRAVRFCRDQMI